MTAPVTALTSSHCPRRSRLMRTSFQHSTAPTRTAVGAYTFLTIMNSFPDACWTAGASRFRLRRQAS